MGTSELSALMKCWAEGGEEYCKGLESNPGGSSITPNPFMLWKPGTLTGRAKEGRVLQRTGILSRGK